MKDMKLPDTDRAENLRELRASVANAASHAEDAQSQQHPDIPPGVPEHISEATEGLHDALTLLSESLSDIPQWDSEYVSELLSTYADRDATQVLTDGSEVRLRFKAGVPGEKEYVRYSTDIVSGEASVQLHRGDDEWETVWEN